jgi:hypothetical protein
LKPLDIDYLYRVCKSIKESAAQDFPSEVDGALDAIIDALSDVQEKFDELEERINKLENKNS